MPDSVDPMYQFVSDFTEIKTTMTHMAADVADVKRDLKEVREGAPLHRIRALEARWKALAYWCGGLTLTVIGGLLTYVLRGG